MEKGALVVKVTAVSFAAPIFSFGNIFGRTGKGVEMGNLIAAVLGGVIMGAVTLASGLGWVIAVILGVVASFLSLVGMSP